jgi:hypothetical protein
MQGNEGDVRKVRSGMFLPEIDEPVRQSCLHPFEYRFLDGRVCTDVSAMRMVRTGDF